MISFMDELILVFNSEVVRIKFVFFLIINKFLLFLEMMLYMSGGVFFF